MQIFHKFKMLPYFGLDFCWQRNRAVLLPFPVVNGEISLAKIEAMNPELQTFEKPESAPIQEFHHKIEWWGQPAQYLIDFPSRVVWISPASDGFCPKGTRGSTMVPSNFTTDDSRFIQERRPHESS